jgi:predicted DNA-binding antitoxin AbrB/MazE fold protein
MAYEIDAIYSNGSFVPVTPIRIPEGARVHLRVDEQSATEIPGKMMTREEMQEFLRMMESLPIESPDDGFSGADHDKLLYGQP